MSNDTWQDMHENLPDLDVLMMSITAQPRNSPESRCRVPFDP
jgi:hypothetical protein